MSADWNWNGRLFYMVGPNTWKLYRPNDFVLVEGTITSLQVAEHSLARAVKLNWNAYVTEVRWARVTNAVECHHHNLGERESLEDVWCIKQVCKYMNEIKSNLKCSTKLNMLNTTCYNYTFSITFHILLTWRIKCHYLVKWELCKQMDTIYNFIWIEIESL